MFFFLPHDSVLDLVRQNFGEQKMDLPTLLKPGFMKGTDEVPIRALMRIITGMQSSNEKVMILKSTTGSGKSTALPAALGLAMPKKIISAQPRVLNAKTIPFQIIKHNPYVLGKNIGYHTGDYQKIPKTGIILVTNGILANYILNKSDKEMCDEYSAIIIDEAHEMDSFGINIHYFLRDFVQRNLDNPACPIIIITSATFDYEHFAEYYRTKIICKVKGFTFPIENHYLPYSSTNYAEDTAKIIEHINAAPIPEDLSQDTPETAEDEQRGDDIIAFFSGKGEMEEVDKILKARKVPIKVVFLNSQVTANETEDYHALTTPSPKLGFARKVILSTNVGETGVTYSFVKHVIDTGFFKPKIFMPDNGCYSFDKQPVSVFAAKQRRGRVGRIAPGHFYPVYTEETMNHMRSKLLNSIYNEDISLTVLYLLRFGLNLFDMKLIYQPSPFSVWSGLEKLYILGYITADLEITNTGHLALQIPRLSAEQIKIILAGYVHRAPILDLIIIALGVGEEIREKKKEKSLFAAEAMCDFIPLVQDFYNFALKPDLQEKIYNMRETIIESLANLGLDPFANSEGSFPHHGDNYYAVMKQCLYEGLRMNLGIWKESFYETPRGLRLFKKYCGNYILYSNIEYNTAYLKSGDVIKKPKILGVTILDGFVNVAEDFY